MDYQDQYCNVTLVTSPSGLLKRVSYPFKRTGTFIITLAAEVTEEEKNGENNDAVWPTTCSFHITPNCFIQPTAQVMWWDSEESRWRRDGISDDEIIAETGRVKFRTIHFAPTCLVQVFNVHIRICTRSFLTWTGTWTLLDTTVHF
jgi:hypothetical protein